MSLNSATTSRCRSGTSCCGSTSTSRSRRGVAVVLAAPGSRTQRMGQEEEKGVLLVCHIVVMIMGHGSS